MYLGRLNRTEAQAEAKATEMSATFEPTLELATISIDKPIINSTGNLFSGCFKFNSTHPIAIKIIDEKQREQFVRELRYLSTLKNGHKNIIHHHGTRSVPCDMPPGFQGTQWPRSLGSSGRWSWGHS